MRLGRGTARKHPSLKDVGMANLDVLETTISTSTAPPLTSTVPAVSASVSEDEYVSLSGSEVSDEEVVQVNASWVPAGPRESPRSKLSMSGRGFVMDDAKEGVNAKEGGTVTPSTSRTAGETVTPTTSRTAGSSSDDDEWSSGTEMEEEEEEGVVMVVQYDKLSVEELVLRGRGELIEFLLGVRRAELATPRCARCVERALSDGNRATALELRVPGQAAMKLRELGEVPKRRVVKAAFEPVPSSSSSSAVTWGDDMPVQRLGTGSVGRMQGRELSASSARPTKGPRTRVAEAGGSGKFASLRRGSREQEHSKPARTPSAAGSLSPRGADATVPKEPSSARLRPEIADLKADRKAKRLSLNPLSLTNDMARAVLSFASHEPEEQPSSIPSTARRTLREPTIPPRSDSLLEKKKKKKKKRSD